MGGKKFQFLTTPSPCRERGARALEERLATAPSAEELKRDASENV
jgi:hypothetical protein